MGLFINTKLSTPGRVEPPRWDDVFVPVTSAKVGGTKIPGYEKYKDDGAGSQGVFTYFFSPTTEEELYFTVQLPHSYKFGTDLHPHVHWIVKSGGGAGEVVNWGLEYCWQAIGAEFTNTTIISGNTEVPNDSSLVADRHYLTELGMISGNIDSVSSMLVCRVFRDATGALGTDDYPNDAGLLEIDFHIQKDTIGSRLEYTK